MLNRCFGMTSAKVGVAALLCCVTALVTGCSSSQFLSVADSSPMLGAAIQGAVHGGQNPITTAAVQMWTVGASGYGSAATKLGPQLATDASGNFSYPASSYTCPSGTSQVYITSAGGNPGLGTGANANIMLAAALGNCSGLSSSTVITINEVTTAAAAFALGQYFTPAVGGLSSADRFGAPSATQAQVGIVNAFATVNNLVATSTGNALTSVTLTGTAGTLTAAPEAAKLNTIANILAACVNSAGGVSGDTSSCGKLFAAVVPTGGVAPTDTLQAAVYMSLNPTSNNALSSATNLGTLFGLITGSAPFQSPTPLSSAPADWTIGIQYSGPTVVATTVLNAPLDIRADSSGNIWIMNVPVTAAPASESLTELSPTGVPLANPWNGGTTGATSMGSSTPRNLAIDLNGNVWVTTSSGSAYVYQWQPNATPVPVGVSMKDPGAPYGIAVDANNNVFIGHGNSASSVTSLDQFISGTLATTNWIKYPLDGSAGNSSSDYGQYAAVDTAGNVWHSAAAASTTATSVVEITALNGVATCGTVPYAAACTPTTDSSLSATYTTDSATGGTLDGVWGLAANTNSMWAGSSTNSTITSLALTGGTGTTYGSTASLSGPRFLAVDGSGNVWASNFNSTSVSELSNSGSILSPQTTGTAPASALGYLHAGISSPTGITIDPSGNVWVANDVAATTSAGASVFELVGAAAPTVTPIALALKNSTVGLKP